MSTFNEADHPRRSDGKWATKDLDETDPGLGASERPGRDARRAELIEQWGPMVERDDLIDRGELASTDISPSARTPTADENHAFLRGLPAYVEVDVVFEEPGDRYARLMARDLPRGAGEDHRRFTQLDAGMELFVGEESDEVSPYGRVTIIQDIKSGTLRSSWPEQWGQAWIGEGEDIVSNEFRAEEFVALHDRLTRTNHRIVGDFYDQTGNVVTDAKFMQADTFGAVTGDMRSPRVIAWDDVAAAGFAVEANRIASWREDLDGLS